MPYSVFSAQFVVNSFLAFNRSDKVQKQSRNIVFVFIIREI